MMAEVRFFDIFFEKDPHLNAVEGNVVFFPKNSKFPTSAWNN